MQNHMRGPLWLILKSYMAMPLGNWGAIEIEIMQ